MPVTPCCAVLVFILIGVNLHAAGAVIHWVSVPVPELVVASGDSATLDCSAYGDFANEPIPISWSKEELTDKVNGTLNSTSKEPSGSSVDLTSSTFPNGSLLISDVDDSTPGVYSCTASNQGSTETRSAELRLAYLSEFLVSPSETVEGSANESVTLECVTGPALPTPTVYWIKDGQRTSSGVQSNATFGEYGFAGSRRLAMKIEVIISEETVGQYQCEAYNQLTKQSVLSQAAAVTQLWADEAPYFSSMPPEHIRVQELLPLLIACTAQGSPPLTITWYHDSAPLNESLVLSNGSLYIQAIDRSDGGLYFCNTSNEFGSKSSQTTEVKVVYLQQEFVQSPVDTIATAEQSIELICIPPQSEPTANISWYKNNLMLDGETEQRIVFSNIQLSDAGDYFCVAHNAFVIPSSQTSDSAVLTVYASPSFVVEMSGDVVVNLGETISLRCQVTGYPPPEVVWFREEAELDMSTRISDSSSDGVHDLYISNAETSDTGSYHCQATNIHGTERSPPIQVTVASPLVLVTVIGNHTVDIGTDVVLPCVYSFTREASVQWLKDGEVIFDWPRFDILPNQGLHIESVQLADIGWYKCLVNDSQSGSSVSSEGYLYVQSTPVITSFLAPDSIDEGDELTISCEGSGAPTPNLTLTHNELAYHGTGEVNAVVSANPREHAGLWMCNATNTLGTAMSDQLITVYYSPKNTRIQGNLIVNVNTSLSLECTSDGLPAAVYSWTVNGKVVRKDNAKDADSFPPNRLVIERAQAENSGNYSCAAANRLGVNPATVQVIVRDVPSPPVDITLNSLSPGQIEVFWSSSDSSTLYYVLEYKRSSESTFGRYDVGNATSSANITGLSPGVQYLVRMSAGNSLGGSPYSIVYTITTMHAVPPAPTDLTVLDALSTPNSLTLQWNGPDVAPTLAIERYQLRHKPMNGTDDDWTLTDVAVEQQLLHTYTLGGLRPYVSYVVKVRAVATFAMGQQVLGDFSQAVSALTPPSAPLYAPTNIEVSVRSSSSVQLEFHKPTGINGPFVGYRVRYSNLSSVANGWHHRQYNTTEETAVLVVDNLLPWRRYSIQISTVNTVGSSPFNDMELFQTFAAAPVTPSRLAITDLTQGSITVSWRALTELEWNSDPSLGSYTIQYWFSSPRLGDPVLVENINATSYTVRGLDAWADYGIRIVAVGRTSLNSSVILSSEPTAALNFKTRQQVPPPPGDLRALPLSQTYMVLSWSEPSAPFRGAVSGYRVIVELNGLVICRIDVSGSQLTLNITGLTASTKYDINITAGNIEGSSPPTHISAITMAAEVYIITTAPVTRPVSLHTSAQFTTATTFSSTNETIDEETAGQSDEPSISKAVLVLVITLPAVILFVPFLAVTVIIYQRKKRRQAKAMEMFGEKSSTRPSNHALTDLVAASYEVEGRSKALYGKLEEESYDMSALEHRPSADGSNPIFPDFADISVVGGATSSDAMEHLTLHFKPQKHTGASKRISPRRRLVEDDFGLHITSEPRSSDQPEDLTAPHTSGFHNPNYSGGDDPSLDLYASTEAAIISSQDIHTFDISIADDDLGPQVATDNHEQQRPVSVRESRIRTDVAEAIANQTIPSEVLANHSNAQSPDNRTHKVIYSIRTAL